MNKSVNSGTLEGSVIDPEIQEFARQLTLRYESLWPESEVTPPVRRQIAERAREPFYSGGASMANTQDLAIDPEGPCIRIYTPKTKSNDSAFIYLHGGGWVMFSIRTHDRLMREYADQSGCTVIGVDYSLAPESQYPKALNEIDLVYKWIENNAENFGISSESIFIGGDSAGGNLALCSTLRRRDSALRLPVGMLLNYAALDTTRRPSYTEFDGPPFLLEANEMDLFWRDYLGETSTNSPYARPLLADLTGLPPTHLCIAECDILRDENLALYDGLIGARVDADIQRYSGATHSFLEAMSLSALAREAITNASVWLAREAKRNAHL